MHKTTTLGTLSYSLLYKQHKKRKKTPPMPRRSRAVKKIKTDVAKTQRKIREYNQTLIDLTQRLEELEVYSAGSKEEL